MPDPRTLIAEAVAAQLTTGLDFPVQRNKAEPADLTDEPEVVILLDGPEDPPETDEATGLTIWAMSMCVEAYVKGNAPTESMNALVAKIRHALVADRTLGGLLWGHLREEYTFPFFDGLKLGGLTEWDAFRQVGASDGGFFAQELLVSYATAPDDALTLVRPESV